MLFNNQIKNNNPIEIFKIFNNRMPNKLFNKIKTAVKLFNLEDAAQITLNIKLDE